MLANVRGLREPIFEHDFLMGIDMMGEIMQEPYTEERLELEFERRLHMNV